LFIAFIAFIEFVALNAFNAINAKNTTQRNTTLLFGLLDFTSADALSADFDCFDSGANFGLDLFEV